MVNGVVAWINSLLSVKAYGIATLSKGGYPEIDQEPLNLEVESAFHIMGQTNVNRVESEFLATDITQGAVSMELYFVLDNDCGDFSLVNVVNTINSASTKLVRSQLSLMSLSVEANQFDEVDRSVWWLDQDFKLPEQKTLKRVDYTINYTSKCLSNDCGDSVNKIIGECIKATCIDDSPTYGFITIDGN